MFILIAVNLSFSLRTPAISQRTKNVLDLRQARLKHDSFFSNFRYCMPGVNGKVERSQSNETVCSTASCSLDQSN